MRFRLVTLALSLAVSATACGGPSGQGEERTQSAADGTTSGVDYSWYRPTPSSLTADGYTFVCRYLSYDTTGKNLSKSEADSLIAAGLDVVSNWEDGAEDALSGYDLGVTDAQAAESQASADGEPSTRPIYFSVDFDATSDDMSAITSYFEGVASVIGTERTGAYGGYYVISQLFDAGKITWGWQTYAWSSGQWDSRAQLRQIENGIADGNMDLDQGVASDFGQWGNYAPTPPDQPRGYLDSATCTTVSGWAQDPAVPTTSIFTDVYYDGPAGGPGVTGIRLTANVDRSDLCKAIGSCDHGYSMSTPRSLLDGRAHSVYAYGIHHAAGGTNTLLTNSPKNITCTAPAIPSGTVKRHVTSPTIFADWRFDTFTDEAPSTGAELAALPEGADLASSPSLVQASGDPAIYVVDGTYRRHVVNPDSFAAWRFTSAEVRSISAAELAALEAGADWPATPLLVNDPGDDPIYMLDVPPDATNDDAADGGMADGGAPDGEAAGAEAGDGAGTSRRGPGSSSACTVAFPGAPHGPAWLLAIVTGLLVVGRARGAGRRTA